MRFKTWLMVLLGWAIAAHLFPAPSSESGKRCIHVASGNPKLIMIRVAF